MRRLALLPFALLTLTSARTGAYSRAEVYGKPGTFLYWPVRTLSWHMHKAGCADVPLNEALGATRRAFFSWSSPSCTDIYFNYAGLESTEQTNLTLSEGDKPDNKNMIIWREAQWPPAGVTDPSVNKDTPAVTTLIYNTDNGLIVDADIDLNGVNFWWTVTDDTKAAATDIENILAHEIGHLLGLGHSEEVEATMFSMTSSAELKKRSLEKDDTAGVCFVYPFSGTTPAGPGQGTVHVDVQGGCALAGDPTNAGSPALLALLALLLGLGRKRRGDGGPAEERRAIRRGRRPCRRTCCTGRNVRPRRCRAPSFRSSATRSAAARGSACRSTARRSRG
jgi:hypothetical protein